MIGRADVSGPRVVTRADVARRVDRVELLRRPVRAPDPARQLHEPGLMRRLPDAAPELKARWSDRVQVACDQGDPSRRTARHIGDDRAELFEAASETHNVEVHDVYAQVGRLGPDGDSFLWRDGAKQRALDPGESADVDLVERQDVKRSAGE